MQESVFGSGCGGGGAHLALSFDEVASTYFPEIGHESLVNQQSSKPYNRDFNASKLYLRGIKLCILISILELENKSDKVESIVVGKVFCSARHCKEMQTLNTNNRIL